jgi:hypothetical protein
LNTAATSNTLSILLPPAFGGQAIESVQVDGAARQPIDFDVAGRTLALVDVDAGKHSFEVHYLRQQATSPPAPTAVVTMPASAATGAPTAAAATAVPSAAPSAVPTNVAQPAPATVGVSPILWAIVAVVVLLVAVVAFLVGRGRSGRR